MGNTKVTPLHSVQSAPDHLREAGRELWASTLREWSLSDAELCTLTVACEAADRLSDIRTELERDGLIMVDPSERKRAHPLLASETQAQGVLLRAWKMLNLTDAEKPKIGRPPTGR